MAREHSELGYWVCASFQHLRSFSQSAENIDEFEATRLAGQIALLLNAVKGRRMINFNELERIAKAQKIGRTTLNNNIIPLIMGLNSERVSIMTRKDRHVGLEEHIDSSEQLYEIIGLLWEMLEPTLIERGAIHVLKHTYVIPRLKRDELNLLSKDGFRDEDAEATLGITASFKIIQVFEARRQDEAVLFNPYIWREKQDRIARALAQMPSQEKAVVTECVEQVKLVQALPVGNLVGNRAMIDTAHGIGLIDIVEVNTAAGDRREFLFTPHLTTHPDVSRYADDLLNDVRAVLACITYGENFSRISRLGGYKRDKTINTLSKLLRQKVAGDATAIGVDYNLLEERGIISVEPTATYPGGRFRMRLLRPEPVKIALKVIEDSVINLSSRPILVHTRTLDPASIFAGPEDT